MTDFATLLYASLPGLYRDKDNAGLLQRFLHVAALPFAEIEESLTELLDDLFIRTCRPEVIALIGELVGAQVDAGLAARAQRGQAQDALRFYRSKGLAEPIGRYAEQLTGWRVRTVDFSQLVIHTPFVEAVDPVQRLRDRPVGELTPGSGRLFFREDLMDGTLFDGVTGRPISRVALAADPVAYAGVEDRFTISDRGEDLFTGSTPYTAVAANLADFSAPRTPAGAPLTVQATGVAIDPELGRFLVGGTPLLAGNLRVSFLTLTPGTLAAQVPALGDPALTARIGRNDDPVPTTLDLRAPRHVTDRTGLRHFDNHGFLCTPTTVVANRRPNALPAPTPSGCFTFDDHPLQAGDLTGIALQLLDGTDGAPLTLARLAGSEALFCGTPRGFSIRVRGVEVSDPARTPLLRVRAANLQDLAQPRDITGAVLTLTATDVAVDPQRGRFRLGQVAAAEDVRVDYLLARSTEVTETRPRQVSAAVSELFAFGADDERSVPVDALDGTTIADALRLGRSLTDYHATPRGWQVRLDGTDVNLPATRMNLAALDASPLAGTLAVDPERGRFRFPSGTSVSADRLAVSYAFADPDDAAQRFDSLAQHLPRAVPAGAVAVITDTRRRPTDAVSLT